MNKLYLYVVGLSEFGSRMNFMAITSLLFTVPNTEWWLMLYFVSRQIGGILFSVFSGTLVDRFDRKKIMIISDILSGLLMISLLFYQNPILVIIVSFFQGMLYQLFYVAYSASIPDLFGKEQASKINAQIVQISSFVSITGFLIGGLLTEAFGYKQVILFDSITYLIAAMFLFLIKTTPSHLFFKQQTEVIKDSNKEIPLQLKFIIIISLFYSLAVGAYNFGLPLLANEYESSALMNGVFWSVASVGTWVGAKLSNKDVNKLNQYFLFYLLFSVILTMLFFSQSLMFIIVLLILSGVLDGKIQTATKSILQKGPTAVLGRIFGYQGLMMRIGFFTSFLICPILLHKMDLASMNGIMQSFTILISLLFIVITSRRNIKRGTSR